jgi:hypothetical protein
VFTIFWPDWIEALTGYDPDQHDGTVEWPIVLALLSSAPYWRSQPESPQSSGFRSWRTLRASCSLAQKPLKRWLYVERAKGFHPEPILEGQAWDRFDALGRPSPNDRNLRN